MGGSPADWWGWVAEVVWPVSGGRLPRWEDRSMAFVTLKGKKRWSEAGESAAPLRQPKGEGEGSGKGSNPDGAIALPAEGGASGSCLVTDWLLLLPPCVKTQMAGFGWSKAPVSYSLGSAQPPRDSRFALGGILR